VGTLTHEERQKLREAAIAATKSVNANARDMSGRLPGDWELQTSNSWRRIGAHGDGDVLLPTSHPRDRHPDLTAPSGVLHYIVAAQPNVVLRLLDQLDAAEVLLSRLAEVEKHLDETDRKFRETQVLVEQLRALKDLPQ
jgi:hypothetical protein